jgi:hypothetical protein
VPELPELEVTQDRVPTLPSRGLIGTLGPLLLALTLPSCALAWNQAQPKDWNIQAELLRLGPGVCLRDSSLVPYADARVIRVTVSYRRFRASAGCLAFAYAGTGANTALPVEIGYSLIRRQIRYGPFRGMMPEVYADVGYFALNGFMDDNYVDPLWKVGLQAEADAYGIGVGAGIAGIIGRQYVHYYRSDDISVIPTLSFYLRIVTNFGF